MSTLVDACERGNRLEQLIELRLRLATAIDECDSMRDLAALSRQYRETLREIDELEGTDNNGDEISEILSQRAADGKPGGIRPNRAQV